MIVKNLTCIECPMGCQIQAKIENEKCVEIIGNGCPRGKITLRAKWFAQCE